MGPGARALIEVAGWRKAGGEPADEEPVGLEILDAEASEVAVDGGRSVDWHAVIRTAAAVVGALSLLWIGRTQADERAAMADRDCANDLQQVMWRWEEAVNARGFRPGEPRFPEDVVEEILERAQECDDLEARAIEYRLTEDDED